MMMHLLLVLLESFFALVASQLAMRCSLRHALSLRGPASPTTRAFRGDCVAFDQADGVLWVQTATTGPSTHVRRIDLAIDRVLILARGVATAGSHCNLACIVLVM